MCFTRTMYSSPQREEKETIHFVFAVIGER